MEQRDVIVIGAGPSGSIAAALLKRRGWDVLVLEGQKFPRFSIGESLLAHCLDFVEEAGMTEAVEAAGFQYKNGAAFIRGAEYSEFDFGDKFTPGRNSTYQVQRATFDKLLADEAEKQGVEIRYEVRVTGVDNSGPLTRVSARDAAGREYDVAGKFILDASGFGPADAHQLIYYRREFRFGQLRDLMMIAFPRAVRDHRHYVALSAAAFLLPTIVVGLLVYTRPEFILSVLNQEAAARFEEMYSPNAPAIGRRTASTDWMMFGYYIRNNISVSFQCFAGGLFAGVGSLFFLAYNGAFGGAIAGYLTERGLSSTFYSFVATHSSFELTAIVLSGAAGLRIGHALLAPGRQTRRQALVLATSETTVLLYGLTIMLIVAAAIEAFWSSAQWLPLPLKYSVAAACWVGVIAFFVLQGRRAD